MCTYGNKILNTLLFHATKKKKHGKDSNKSKISFRFNDRNTGNIYFFQSSYCTLCIRVNDKRQNH